MAAAQDMIEELSPLPKSSSARLRKRKPDISKLITSSPFKKELEERVKSSKTKMKVESNSKSKKICNVEKKRNMKMVIVPSPEKEDYSCIICGDKFYNSKSREQWVECQECKK